MLLLALALSGAVTTADNPQRYRKARTTRVARITRIPARAAPTRSVLVATPTDPNTRYRLPLASTEVVDPKTDAVKSTGMACGTTGAPWCPRDGRTVLKTSLGDN
ncbi:hypothetical protein HZY97_10785 [Sphingomonas sp. R-74633]|uniref:hypothetical protein n=1 Tax=Sphingomonas sp. R-74633 TaxID=2751188 RepID=UPI0015D25AB2|nr:hypothetical protein [Sphingomonas sp. R-74633]NYT41244.1 hypothetical protein [Sphingomonas sp. R-74633]